MRKLINLPIVVGVALAVLVGGLAAPTVMADCSGTATITINARGAAEGQRVEVQWGDSIGGWHRVDGWSGSLDKITPQGVPFQRYTVGCTNFGQGPFRWVVYAADGVSLWSVGPNFTLPTVPGTDLMQPFNQQYFPASAPAAPTAVPAVPAGAATPTATGPGMTAPAVLPTGERVLAANTFTLSQGCAGDCSHSKITALVGGLPSYTWITVQWLDGYGIWHPVDGWQGTASSIDNNGVLLKQWDIPPSLFNLGPFRWAIYAYAGGPLIGVSPNFNMPKTAQLDFFVSLS
jgi:hypothetical protein